MVCTSPRKGKVSIDTSDHNAASGTLCRYLRTLSTDTNCLFVKRDTLRKKEGGQTITNNGLPWKGNQERSVKGAAITSTAPSR